MRPIDAYLARLESAGCGIGGTTIFVGADVNLPDGPGPFLTLIETGGIASVGTHQEPTAIRQPYVQATARGDLYDATAALADRTFDALNVSNLQIGDLFFLWIRPVQNPFQLPNDANGRVRLVTNFGSAVRHAA